MQSRFKTFNVVGGPPQEVITGSRTFWKIKAKVTIQNHTAHVVEAVTTEKGYVLIFVFASPDESKIDDLAGTLFTVSLHRS